MIRAEDLKKEIDVLPPSMLVEVEMFIRNLKKKAKKSSKPVTLLSDLAEYAIEDNLPADLSEQHNHYLYGVSKK